MRLDELRQQVPPTFLSQLSALKAAVVKKTLSIIGRRPCLFSKRYLRPYQMGASLKGRMPKPRVIWDCPANTNQQRIKLPCKGVLPTARIRRAILARASPMHELSLLLVELAMQLHWHIWGQQFCWSNACSSFALACARAVCLVFGTVY